MRKFFFFLVAMAMCLVMPLNAAVTYYLGPVSFEDGQIPSGWAVDTLWSVEGGQDTTLTFPDGAADGYYRVTAKCGNNSYDEVNASLVTPAVNLVNMEPVLSFSYAAPAFEGKCDTLFVLYRLNASAEWTTLATYARVPSWKRVYEMELPQASISGTAVQVKFVMHHGSGSSNIYGASLDNIMIYQRSSCESPEISTFSLEKSLVYAEFTPHAGGAESTFYDVLISGSKVDPDTVKDFSGFEYYAAGSFDNYVEHDSLEANTKYWLYVRSNCGDNLTGYTDWTEKAFTSPQLINVPYVESFDETSSMVGWGTYCSAGLSGVPAVITSSTYMKSFSLNDSKSLYFGAKSTTPTSVGGCLSAGQYVYATTPQVNNIPLNQLQLSFWGTAYLHTPGQYAPVLEIGVMTDPENPSSFELIDSVTIESAQQFKKFTISFASYTGEGYTVAFRCKGGELLNQFAIDDVTFEQIDIPVPAQPVLTAITPSQLNLSVNKNGADSWNLMLANSYDHDTIPAAILSQSGISANTYSLSIPDSLQGKVVTIYAQGVKGGVAGEWSFPLTVRIPQLIADTVPVTMSLTETYSTKTLENEFKSSYSGKSVPAIAHFQLENSTYVPTISSSAISLPTVGNYFALGYLPTLNTKEIVFYLRGSSSVAGKVALGVMTNPYDASTFELLAEFDGEKSSTEFSECIYDLDQYTGNGHYLAFKSEASANMIKDIQIDSIPTCRKVTAVDCTAGSSKATLSWDANNMSSWQVVVSTSSTFADTVANEVVDTAYCVVSGLESEQTYYYKVNTICGTDTVQMYGKKSFTTALGIPYSVPFSSSTPSGWTQATGLLEDVFNGTALTSSSSGWTTTTAGAGYLTLDGYAARYEIWSTGKKQWLITPNISLSDYAGQNIRLTFDAALTPYSSSYASSRNSGTDDKFAVVISTDNGVTWNRANATIWSNDSTGNRSLNALPMTSFEKVAIDLSSYSNGTVKIGFYAESTVSNADNYIYVDNVNVSVFDPNCPGMTKVAALNVTDASAEIDWTADGTQRALIQVATADNFADSVLVYSDTVEVTPTLVNNLEGNTQYYVRAVQVCDPNQEYQSASFKTLCDSITPAEFGTETFSATGVLDCWKVDHATDGSSSYASNEPVVASLTGFGKMLQFSRTSTTYNDGLYAITPAFLIPDSMNHYQVEFDAVNTSTSASAINRLKVGVVYNPSDLSTFSIIKTIAVSAAADSTKMKHYTVPFDKYDGDDNEDYGTYVGFMVEGGDSLYTINIDNVQLNVLSSCRTLEDIVSKNISVTSAELAWDSIAPQYEVALFQYRSIDSAKVFSAVVDSNAIHIDSLNSNTTYYATVRAICQEGDTANWSAFVELHTECAAVTEFPWSENFDSIAAGNLAIDCWSNYHSAGTGTTVFQVNTSTVGDNKTHTLKLPDAQVGNQVRLELPFMDIPEANAYEFRMDMYRLSSNKLLEGIIVTAEQGENVDTLLWIPRSMEASTATVEAVSEAGWYKYSAAIPFVGEGKIVLTGYSQYGNYSSADNLEVRLIPTCSTPKHLQAAAVGLDTAQVVWQGESTTGYIVELATNSDYSTKVDSVLVNDTACTFHGLVNSSTYYVRVHSNCDGGDMATTNFTTLVGLPFTENFDATSSSCPSGWTRGSGDIYNDSTFSTVTFNWSFGNGNAGGLTTYHAYSYVSSSYSDRFLMTPSIVMNSKAGDNIKLSFDMSLNTSTTGTTAPTTTVSDGRHFSVAVLTDTSLVPVMVWGDTLATGGKYAKIPKTAENFEADLSQFAGQKIQLIFFHSIGSSTASSSSYISVDNIKLESYNPNCMAPALSILDATTDSMTVYVANTDSSSYQLQISTSSSFAIVLDSVVTQDTLAGFHGLTPATTYYIRGKKLCDEGEESAWSEAISSMTDCAPYEIPFTKVFDDGVSGNYDLPLCWTKVKANGNYPYIYYYYDALYFSGGTSSTQQIVALPEVNMPLSKLTFSMNYKNYSATTSSPAFIIGTYSDLDSTFMPLVTVDRVTSATDYELMLSNAPANAKYLAIKYANGTSSSYGYIYSMSLTQTPTCMPLQSVEFSNVERRSLDINWTPKVAPANGYELIFSDTAVVDSMLDKTASIKLDTTFYHLDNLTRATTYYVYVRGNCGSEDGFGDWLSGTVTTKQIGPDCSSSTPGTISLTGDGSAYAPISCFYKNSYVEQIYTAAELKAAGLKAGYVSSVAFQYLLSTAYTKDVTLYMGSTTDATFASTSLIKPEAASTAQSITFDTANKWYEFELTTPYYWDGNSNLIVGVDAQGTAYWATGVAGFAGGETTGNTVLYARSDSQDPYSSSTGTASTARANAIFHICPMGVPCPATDEASYELPGDGTTEAKISWSSSTGDYANTYMFCYADNDSIAPDSIATKYTGIDSLSITLTGLTADTKYYGYIKTVCDAEGHDDGTSTWFPISFQTNPNCPSVVDLTAAPTGKNSAQATWSTKYAEQEKTFYYVLSTSELSKDTLAQMTLLEADTNVLAWDTLSCAQTYYLYVASKCGAAKSLWQSISFTQPQHCPAVQNLHAVSIEYNCIQLAWDKGEYGEETEWEVGIQGGQSKYTSDQMILLIGLEPASNYTAYVKAVCSDSESSLPTTLAFTTANTPTTDKQIGEGTSTSYLAYGSYGNTYSEQIYTAAELQAMGAEAGSIISVSFDYFGSTSALDKVQSIYIGSTDQDAFAASDASGFISGLDLVYGAEQRTCASGWQQYDFNSSFAWNGTSNIVVGVLTNQPDGASHTGSSGWTTRGTTQDAYRSIYRYQDRTAVDPDDLSSVGYGSYSLTRPNIKFGFAPEDCARVTKLQVDTVTKDSAAISWFPGGSETNWNTLLSDTVMTEAQLATAPFDTTDAYTKHFSGLNDDADYYFYVRAACSATEHGKWKELHFITDAACRAPKDIHTDTIAGTFAKLSWSNNSDAIPAAYVVAYGESDVFNLDSADTYHTVTVTDTTTTLTGLKGITNYTVAISSTCDAQNHSRWSEPFEFKTECASFNVPWVENFENTELECWNVLAEEGSVTVYSSSYYALTGSKSLLFNNAYQQVAVLPDFGDLNGLQLTFNYRTYNTAKYYSGQFEAGYVTNPNDSSTFVSLTGVLGYTTSYAMVEVPYVSGIPAGARPAIRHLESYYGYSSYGDNVDSVRMDSVPSCMKPELNMTASSCSSVTIALGEQDNYLLELSSDADFTSLVDSVLVTNDTAYTATGLAAGSIYYARAQRVCSSSLSSKWSHVLSVQTAYGIPFTEEFASGLPATWSLAKGTAASVFSGTLPTAYTSGWSSQSASSAPTNMGDNMKLNIYGTAINHWMFTPVIDATDTAAYTNLRLTFDAAWTAYGKTTAPTLTSTDEEFLVAVSIDGGKTFSKANAFIWSNDATEATEGALDSISASAQKMTLDLSRFVGHNIQIGFYGETTVSEGTADDNDIHVANINLKAYNPNCQGISTIDVKNITTNRADVHFAYAAGSHDAYIEVSTNNAYSTVVASDTILNDSVYYLDHLQASSTYYVRIKQLCGEGEESAYTETTFQTGMGLPFKPDFTDGIPSDWKLYSYLVESQTFSTSDFSTTTGGWKQTSADTVINSAHIKGNIYGGSWKYWLVTPAIDLSENVGQGVMLNVDLGLTPYQNNSTYIVKRNTGTDDRFMIAISEDGGLTWNTANATIWDNDSTTEFIGKHQSYNGVPEHGKTYHVNLTDYTGKSIAIGFYGESTLTNADNYFHFGNIKLDTVKTTPVFDTICAGPDYAKYGFEVAYEDYHVGDNIYSHVTEAVDTLHQDSITTLHLFVKPLSVTNIYDTICAGEEYHNNGFDIANPKTMAYQQHLTAANGCDSLLTLNLKVNPILTSELYIRRCTPPYTYRGTEYWSNQIFTDSLTSALTGCDSIVTTYLEFAEAPAPSSSHNELICSGEKYADDVFTDSIAIPGTYTGSIASIYGCDSVVTLKLLVADALGAAYDTIRSTQLPYVLGGETLVDASKPAGSYTAVVSTSCGNVTVHINVLDVTAIDENLLKSGHAQKVFINGVIYIVLDGHWYDAFGKAVEAQL